MDLQNKVYLVFQVFFVILFIPFIAVSMLLSLILTTINGFFHQQEDEDQNKSNQNT
jgi:hypothetical protein